jgi:cell wall-associated NlpC family hydrolase
MVYKINGTQIPRDANKQAEIGITIDFINEAHEGDLVFFDNEEGNIIHVGIYLGNSKIIHASGKVRIDTIDHQGIFNTDTQKYTHKLRIIKRINN